MWALVVLAALFGAIFDSHFAFAWGDIRHRVICQIAYEELKPVINTALTPGSGLAPLVDT